MANISDPNPQFWMRYLQVFSGLAAQVRLAIDQSGQDTKVHKDLISDWVTKVIPKSIEASSSLDFSGNTEAAELFDAAKGEGGAVKKRVEIEKVAESNRAFSHFRW